MIVSRIITEKAFDGLKGRWLKSFSGDRFVFLHVEEVKRYRLFESPGHYGTGEIRQMKNFEYKEYLTCETIESASVCDGLETDLQSAER